MQLHGKAVLNYNITEDILTICIKADSIESAKEVISEEMMLKDGVGNDFLSLSGFCDIKRITLLESLGAYELIVARKSDTERQIATLQETNEQLKEQLANAVQSNELLENCMVEVATGNISEATASLFAQRIEHGKHAFENVPTKVQSAVADKLQNKGLSHLVTKPHEKHN